MPNLVKVDYEQTRKSKSTNELGMREMQSIYCVFVIGG